MSMYHQILLRPVDVLCVPSIDNIIRLVKWLIENEAIKEPSDAAPITVDFELTPADDEANDPGELLEFAVIDDNFKKHLTGWSEWIIELYSKNLTGKGSIAECFKLDSSKLDWTHVKLSENERESSTSGNFSLRSISMYHVNISNFFENKEWDASYSEGKFAIEFGSDMRLSYPIEDLEEYFNLVWPCLQSSGIIAEMENILGVKLQAQPAFG